MRLSIHIVFALALAALVAGPAPAQQVFNAADIEAGMKLYKPDQADCEFCHAWSGRGRYHDTPYSDVTAGGPSLVASTRTRAQLIEIISCGHMLEGRIAVMPYYRGDAWTPAYRCGGQVKADVAPGMLPLTGMKQLTPAQIEQMVTYLQAVIIGTGMSTEWCRKYWGPQEQRICDLR